MKTYSECQKSLKQEAKEAKKMYPTDKPAIRQIINDYMDFLCKSYNLTDKQRDLLSNFACKLHPTN